MIITNDTELVGPWVCEKVGVKWVSGRGAAIGQLNEKGELVAGVLYEDWSGANIFVHMAATGLWAKKEFLNVAFDYAFNFLKVNRVTAMIESNNTRCLRLAHRAGFELECTLKGASKSGDVLIFRMFKSDCKYTKGQE